MNKITTPSLEDRIRTALANQLGSDVLTELIISVDQAVETATLAAQQERTKSVDLTLSPDAKAAHERVVEADMLHARLSAARKPLADRLSTALESERHSRWLAEYRKAKAEHDSLAQEFADRYPAIVAELVDLLNRMQQCDRKCGEVDAQASNLNNEHRRLGKVELHARGLEAFSRDYRPEISKAVVLPDFVESTRMRWPQRSPTAMAAQFASSMVPAPSAGARWGEPDVVATRRAEVEKNQAELGEHYAKMTADQERRDNEAEKARFTQAQQRRG